jgi:hypothetical protein
MRVLGSLYLHALRLRHAMAVRGQRGTEQKAQPEIPFLLGVNLPWLSYGSDFGTNAWNPGGGIASKGCAEKLEAVFSGLAREGVNCLRWFLFCDARAGICRDAKGRPVGLDGRVFTDLDLALAIAGRHGMRVIFVLFDFHLCAEAREKNGVQMGGRSAWITNRSCRRALRENVLKPLLLRYGHSPEILAWDIFNEPEWATSGMGRGETAARLSPWRMRRFLARTSHLVQRLTDQQATVGLASARGLPLVRGIGLDLFQVHWYDRFDADSPLDAPVRRLGLDRPLLLGEFPTRGSARSRADIVETARRNGYCGALAWSVLAVDSVSGIQLSDHPETTGSIAPPEATQPGPGVRVRETF